MYKEKIISILSTIVHPEEGKNIVELGFVEGVSCTEDKISFTINFSKARDPFANSIKRSAEAAVREALPEFKGAITIYIKEAAPKKTEKPERKTSTNNIKNIIAISSGKGGVGKSTVTANVAVALARLGYSVGIIDADIYGPSMPKMFGVEGFSPLAELVDGQELIIPAESHGVKIMSIGFFIKSDDALVWRGAMATNALRQLIHQTLWKDLDFLLIDMPPGTGDIHLTIVQELAVTGAVIVSTPQAVALADVVRGIKMFRSEGINVPVLGLIENMAWFTPAELPENKYYIFGKSGCEKLAANENIPLIGQIPIVQSICESGDTGRPIALEDSITGEAFIELARNLVARTEVRNSTLDATRPVIVK